MKKKFNHEGTKARRITRRRLYSFFFLPPSCLCAFVVKLAFAAGIAAADEKRLFFLERKKQRAFTFWSFASC
jgi:hypothetical protein